MPRLISTASATPANSAASSGLSTIAGAARRRAARWRRNWSRRCWSAPERADGGRERGVGGDDGVEGRGVGRGGNGHVVFASFRGVFGSSDGTWTVLWSPNKGRGRNSRPVPVLPRMALIEPRRLFSSTRRTWEARVGWLAAASPALRLHDQRGEAGAGVLAVARLAGIALGENDDHALLGGAPPRRAGSAGSPRPSQAWASARSNRNSTAPAPC